MLRRVDELRQYIVDATDGEIGPLLDIIVDKDWNCTFAKVDIGTSDTDHKVLIPVSALWSPDEGRLPITLNSFQAANAADAESIEGTESDLDLSGEDSTRTYDEFDEGISEPQGPEEESLNPLARQLVGVKRLQGLEVLASGAKAGTLDDLLIDDERWEVTHAIIHRPIPSDILVPVSSLILSIDSNLLETRLTLHDLDSMEEFNLDRVASQTARH